MALYNFSHFSLLYEYTSIDYDKQYIKLKLGINRIQNRIECLKSNDVETGVTSSHDVISLET